MITFWNWRRFLKMHFICFITIIQPENLKKIQVNTKKMWNNIFHKFCFLFSLWFTFLEIYVKTEVIQIKLWKIIKCQVSVYSTLKISRKPYYIYIYISCEKLMILKLPFFKKLSSNLCKIKSFPFILGKIQHRITSIFSH